MNFPELRSLNSDTHDGQGLPGDERHDEGIEGEFEREGKLKQEQGAYWDEPGSNRDLSG